MAINFSKPKNHGKYWTVGDMWELAIDYDMDVPWHTIAKKLKRTRAACASRISIIKFAFLMHHGTSADTLMKKIEIGQYVKERKDGK